MSKLPSDNPHRNHRLRVKERFLKGGLDAFSPHEILELILFYAIPQKDTNVIGHRLIERFGSLSGVFSARQEELCEVDGISEHAATLLRLWLPAASYALSREDEAGDCVFDRIGRIGEYFVRRYIGVGCETVYLMLLDNSYRLIDCAKIYEGSVNSVAVTARKLIETALFRGASMAVLAHNHPHGTVIPSSDDLCTTDAMRAAFETVGIAFLEHVLVAGDKFTPIIHQTNQMRTNHARSKTFYSDIAVLPDYCFEEGEE